MAAKTKAGNSAEEIVKAIKARDFSPIYLIGGEDSYSADQLVDFIENSILTEDEKEFNQTILYGAEVSIEDVVANAKRFPMMSEYQVVIVKEAQLIKEFKNIESYVDKPQTSTILVLSFHSKSADKRIKAVQKIAKDYVMLEFPAIKEDMLPRWISNYFHDKGYAIEPKAAELLAEFTGPDLSRASMEADKIMLNENKGYKYTSSDLEKHVGLNKEYNIFELQNALSRRDVFTSNSIAFYIAKNQKERPLPVVISLLYTHFSKVLMYHYLKSKGEPNIEKALGVWTGRLREYEIAARNFSPAKLIHVIHHLRRADLQFKGYHSGSIDAEGILMELIFKIIH
jgi:DNA polymerase III subunit delta